MLRVHEFRDAPNLALLIYAGQNAVALGQDYAIAAASQLINMLDLGGRNRRTRSLQKELLVILYRPAKLDIQLGDDKEHAGRLEVFIRHTVRRRPYPSRRNGPRYLSYGSKLSFVLENP